MGADLFKDTFKRLTSEFPDPKTEKSQALQCMQPFTSNSSRENPVMGLRPKKAGKEKAPNSSFHSQLLQGLTHLQPHHQALSSQAHYKERRALGRQDQT